MEEEPTIELGTYLGDSITVDPERLALMALVDEMSRRHGLE